MKNVIWVTGMIGLIAALFLGTSACVKDEGPSGSGDADSDANSDSVKLEGAWAEVGREWDGIVIDEQRRVFELQCDDNVYIQDGNTDERILLEYITAKNGIIEIDQEKPGEITDGLKSITYSFEDDKLTLEITWESESATIVFFRVELEATCAEGNGDEGSDGDEDEDEDEDIVLDTDGEICSGAPVACDKTYVGLNDCGFIIEDGQEAFCDDCAGWHVDDVLDCFYSLSGEAFEGDAMGCDWIIEECAEILEASSWYSA